jgi:uncharacterized membrane protein YebE (DUF533 family)
MDFEYDLLGGVLRSVLGGRRKRSTRALRYLTGGLTRGVGGAVSGIGRKGFWTRPSTLLGAAGVAWGIFETLQGSQGSPGAQGSGRAGAQGPVPGSPAPGSPLPPPIPTETPAPPLPNVAAPPAVTADALRLMRLAVSAAHADGAMNEQERAAILLQAKKAGIDTVFGPEIERPRSLAEIVSGVSDPAERATLYVMAYTVLRADEQVTGAERIYLAQLANLLGLDAPTVAKLETDTGERIDALGDQGQPGG